MDLSNFKNILLFSGSSLTVCASLLAAFVPGLAFLSVHSFFIDVPNPPYGLPYVSYQSLNLSTHIYTARFIFAALGGFLGLVAVTWKHKQTLIGAFAIAATGFGLISPAYGDKRATFPEMLLFDVPWIGTILVLVGLSLMFLGLSIHKSGLPRWSFLGIPILLTAYAIYPSLVSAGFLPWIVFGNIANPFNMLMLLLMIAAPLLMIWGILSGSNHSRE